MKKLIIGSIISAGCATGIANVNSQLTVDHNGRMSVSANAISTLKKATAQKTDNHTTARSTILRTYGLRVGQQYGFAMQLENLQDKLADASGGLNDIFNFNFILSYANENSPAINILPPVLLKASNYVESHGGQSISISNEHYTLYKQASLVTVVPTWRDYLIKAIPMPQEVTDAFLPHDSLEKSIWSEAIDTGFTLGVKQADEEMNYRINLLDRDFNGMVTYLKLLQAGKVSSPYVAYSHQSVVGNGESMSVNQDMFRITTNSKLITNPNQWKFLSQEKIK